MGACVVLTSVGGVKAAESLARRLVAQKLAACVTVLPGARSHFRWKRKIALSRETLLLIKTDRRVWTRLCGFLRKHHPYELPELIGWSVSKGSGEYLSWLQACLKK
jgi:periplasmic divalent cation tolerance protein